MELQIETLSQQEPSIGIFISARGQSTDNVPSTDYYQS